MLSGLYGGSPCLGKLQLGVAGLRFRLLGLGVQAKGLRLRLVEGIGLEHRSLICSW